MLLDSPGMRVALVFVLIATFVGCKKKSQQGLPAATDWQNGNAEVAQLQRPEAVAPSGGNDPHEGMNVDEGDGDEEEGSTGGQLPPGHPDPTANAHATTSNDPALRIKGVLKVS